MASPAEEIDSLLDEIPRATSAPPHFGNSSQESPASYLPDALFERRLPASFSDSHGMSSEENPNSSPGGDQLMVGNALADLSLQEQETKSFRMLPGNRNTVYNQNLLMQGFLDMKPAPSASYANHLPQLSSMSAPSFMKSVSVLPSQSFADAKFLDQSYLQEGQLNHQSSPASNTPGGSEFFRSRSAFLGDEQVFPFGAKNIMLKQGFEQHRITQLASPWGYEWSIPLQKDSYSVSLAEDLCNPSASPLLVSKPCSRSVHSKDLYGNCLTASSPEFTQDGQAMSLMWPQKLQVACITREENLNMQQLQYGLNESLYDQLRCVKTPARYPTYMTKSEDIGYSSGSVLPASENALSGNMSNFRFYAQGHLIHGRDCRFSHLASFRGGAPLMCSSKESFEGAGLYNKLDGLAPIQGFQQRHPQTNGNNNQFTVIPAGRRREDKAGWSVGNSLLLLEEGITFKSLLDESPGSLQQDFKSSNLEDLEGKILSIAKDQHGCRFLQRMLDEKKPEDMDMIFQEIKEHLVQMMTDPFGDYLVQKLLDACNESHHTVILEAVTKNNDLINISLNMHGTRAVQKLIETLHAPEQTAILISCLKQGVIALIKDLNGNHVVQRCLQILENNDNQFIFDAAASHCMEIASHRHGCCVLQRCLDFASNIQQRQLVSEIAANAFALSQDQYGNYVVQYILDLGLPWALAEVVSRLEGSFPDLSMQKFSSNVVEKCLKVATEESKSNIIKELVSSSLLSQLCQDPFANYVVQSALQVSKGQLHASIVDAIRPLAHELRNSPYSKRILSHTHFKK